MSRNRMHYGLLALALAMGPLVMSLYAAGTWTMKDGDTLWDIARITYGDPSFYTDLQQANNIANPRTIPTGTVIVLPSKQALVKLRGVTDPTQRAAILKADGAGGSSSGASSTASSLPGAATPFDPVNAMQSKNPVPSVGK